MKKTTLVFLVLMFFTILCGCYKNHTVAYNGREYTLNTTEKTVTDGTNTYRYELDGTESHPSVKIIYPDGSSYYSIKQGNAYISGNSDDYGNSDYAEGSILCDIVFDANSGKSTAKVIPLALILIIIGVLDIVIPEKMWKLSYGWRFKNAEPSDASLIFFRVSGAVIILIAIIFILI